MALLTKSPEQVVRFLQCSFVYLVRVVRVYLYGVFITLLGHFTTIRNNTLEIRIYKLLEMIKYIASLRYNIVNFYRSNVILFTAITIF